VTAGPTAKARTSADQDWNTGDYYRPMVSDMNQISEFMSKNENSRMSVHNQNHVHYQLLLPHFQVLDKFY